MELDKKQGVNILAGRENTIKLTIIKRLITGRFLPFILSLFFMQNLFAQNEIDERYLNAIEFIKNRDTIKYELTKYCKSNKDKNKIIKKNFPNSIFQFKIYNEVQDLKSLKTGTFFLDSVCGYNDFMNKVNICIDPTLRLNLSDFSTNMNSTFLLVFSCLFGNVIIAEIHKVRKNNIKHDFEYDSRTGIIFYFNDKKEIVKYWFSNIIGG